MQPVLAPRSSTSNSQHLSRPQGIVKTSSRLPVPSAIHNPANRMPLVSRGVPSVRGAPAPESLPARRGLPRSSPLGHRGEVDRQVAIRVGAGQRLLSTEQLASFPSSFSQQWIWAEYVVFRSLMFSYLGWEVWGTKHESHMSLAFI